VSAIGVKVMSQCKGGPIWGVLGDGVLPIEFFLIQRITRAASSLLPHYQQAECAQGYIATWCFLNQRNQTLSATKMHCFIRKATLMPGNRFTG